VPVLVVVTGPPGASKSTLARVLANELRLPLVSKDDVKETLFESLGWSDRDWSRRLGAAAYDLLFLVAGELLRSGVSAIVEANFANSVPFDRLPSHRVVQVFPRAGGRPARALREPPAASRSRRRRDARGDRATPAGRRVAALDLPGPLLELDTSRPLDARAVAAAILGT